MKIVSIIIILFLSSELLAQDDFDFNVAEETEGFRFPLTGRISFETARQLKSKKRWILLGPSLNIKFDYNSSIGQIYIGATQHYNLSYRLEDDSKYTIHNYEFEFLFRELFWKKAFSKFTISVGRILDVWGVMDIFQIVDKVPTINRASYFFADPEEVKLGQNMIKLEYFQNNMDAGILIIPYPSFDKITDRDHPYSIIKNQALHYENNKHEVEVGFYINKFYPKGLVSFYAGRFNNRIPIIDIKKSSNMKPAFYKIYPPYSLVGGSTNIAFEPFLLKVEAIYNFNRPLQSLKNNVPNGYLKQDQLETAIGTDYNNGNGGIFILELSGSFPLKKNEMLAVNRSQFSGAIGWSNNYFNDKLKMNFVTFFAESIKNIISRYSVEYNVTNTCSLAAKYTLFSINEKKGDYSFMDDYDRIDISFNYNFNFN